MTPRASCADALAVIEMVNRHPLCFAARTKWLRSNGSGLALISNQMPPSAAGFATHSVRFSLSAQGDRCKPAAFGSRTRNAPQRPWAIRFCAEAALPAGLVGPEALLSIAAVRFEFALGDWHGCKCAPRAKYEARCAEFGQSAAITIHAVGDKAVQICETDTERPVVSYGQLAIDKRKTPHKRSEIRAMLHRKIWQKCDRPLEIRTDARSRRARPCRIAS
jgi:hypothetical protein